jgi:effector-binding domain-containing protein
MADGIEFLIGQMRVQTTCEETLFYVASSPTAMSDLDQQLDLLMPQLKAAQAAAGIEQVGPVVIRYFGAGDPDSYVLEVGVPVRAGTPAAGAARVKTLPPCRCAALLYWGSLEHIGQAYETLHGAIKEAGLDRGSEGREWYYHFEGDASPNNVIGLHLEVR